MKHKQYCKALYLPDTAPGVWTLLPVCNAQDVNEAPGCKGQNVDIAERGRYDPIAD